MYTEPVHDRIGMAPVALLTFVGCATLHPVPLGPGGIPEARRAVMERGGLRATVAVGAWTGAPRDLDRTLLLLHLTVENGSAELIRLPLDRVTLLDPARRQWRPLTPAEAHALALSGRGAGPGFSFGIAGGSGGVGIGFGAGIPLGGPPASGYPDILSGGFSDREISPGDRVEGFLYFPRLDPEMSRFTLVLSPLGEEEMSFDFALER